MTRYQLCQEVRRRHKSGESFRLIARDFGITKPMASLIYHGYKPGKTVSAILGLEPEPKLQHTRTRRERLDAQAREWGYASWCAYETAVLNVRTITLSDAEMCHYNAAISRMVKDFDKPILAEQLFRKDTK